MKNIIKFSNFINEEYIPKDKNHQFFIDMFKKLNYNIIKNIAGGEYGHCYLTDKNTILKYTAAISDACAALILLNRKNEYLVDYYDVFNIIYNNEKYIVIEMEYVKPFNKEKMNKVEDEILSLRNNNLYRLHYNSYVRDIFKIKKEAKEKNVRLDLQNSNNFGIKNNHLCAIDLYGGGLFDKFEMYKKNVRNINMN